MEIPLTLRSPRPDRLVYAIPHWYRVVIVLILIALLTGVGVAGVRPGPVAWAVLALVALGGLYEETWVFDAQAGRIVHRAGLVLAARRTVIEFPAIERFAIVPMVAGTVPGTDEERLENAAALAGQHRLDRNRKLFTHKKPFLNLVIECVDEQYLVDQLPIEDAKKLRQLAGRFAALCDKPLADG